MRPNRIRFDVLGVRVDAININTVLQRVSSAVKEGSKGYVCITGAHGILEARKAPALRRILNSAFCNVPDGMPLVWVGRSYGHSQTERVYGPELMLAVCERSVSEDRSHFLFGGKEGVAEELRKNLETMFPGIRIAGTYCPPFRPLNENESAQIIRQVKEARPDYFWVGMSTPKQERFMAEYLPRLDTRIMFGVGAAFDVHTNRMVDAPAWVKRIGMQWFHRMCQEPGRLARRYAFIVPSFLFLIALQYLGLLKNQTHD